MSDTPNFWEGTHPLTSEYNHLYGILVPDIGSSQTLQGELLRAATRIAYDLYNNGWGCNNWSGAVNFLMSQFNRLAHKPSEEKLIVFSNALKWVYHYSRGEPFADDYNELYQTADKMVTTILEIVVQSLVDNPDPVSNTTNMFDLQEKDYDYGYS